MRRRRVALGALLLTLLASSAIYVAFGLRVYAHYGAAYADYTTACDTLVAWSPPQTLYTGFYPNLSTLVTVRYRSPRPEATRLTISIPGFTQPQSLDANSAQGFRSASFKPPLLTSNTLDALAQQQRHDAQIRLQLTAGAHLLCATSAPITLISRQWIQWRNSATGVSNMPLIAGWVTPNDPSITTLRGRAAKRLSDNPIAYDATPALFGYDQGAATPQQVRDQVDALFDTLQFDYHLRYASDNPPFTPDTAQQVLLPRDVLAESAPTGMCVETSVIRASAVERLGMRPFIVFTSDHAILGVAVSDDPHALVEYWETSDLNGGVTGAQANNDGDLKYAQYVQTHQIKEIIDIQHERNLGIAPME